MMCVVLKPFLSNGVDFVRDELVDGGQFRNVNVLLSQRFLRYATQDEVASAQFEGEKDESSEAEEPEESAQGSSDDTAGPSMPSPKKTLKAGAAHTTRAVKKKAKSLKAKVKTRRR